MGKKALAPNHQKDDDTQRALQEAAHEIAVATRPRAHRWRDWFPWVMALAAGASIGWRSYEAGRRPQAGHRFHPDAKQPAASPGAARQDHPESEEARYADAAAECPPTETSAEPKVQGGLVAYSKEFGKRFSADQCPVQAQALSFVGIVSLVPLLLCALAALSFLIRDPVQAADDVQRFLRHLVPGDQAGMAATQFIEQAHVVESARTLMDGKWWAVLLGVGALLWAALSLFVSATTPMNAAWEISETRSFFKLRLVALGVFVAAGVLFVVSVLLSSGPDFVRNLHIPWLGLPKPTPFWIDALFELLAWCIDIAMFVVIYRYLPATQVTWRAALFGGVIIGFLWELFKKGFALYLAHFGNYNKAYGALGGIFLLLTWIYYSCIILLAGALLCKMYHEHREEGGVKCRDDATVRATAPGA